MIDFLSEVAVEKDIYKITNYKVRGINTNLDYSHPDFDDNPTKVDVEKILLVDFTFTHKKNNTKEEQSYFFFLHKKGENWELSRTYHWYEKNKETCFFCGWDRGKPAYSKMVDGQFHASHTCLVFKERKEELCDILLNDKKIRLKLLFNQ